MATVTPFLFHMSKTKFTLAENPMRSGERSDGGAGLFIIHHLEPVMIFEVDIEPLPDLIGDTFTHNGVDGLENWYIGIVYVSNKGLKDNEILHVTKRAIKWFKAYLDYEDSVHNQNLN
ncbi:MAG: hypothetical protein LAT81_14255 [Oceanicaulis sp.]|nr:hypothetical protein [Oceanicaulis sp.]